MNELVKNGLSNFINYLILELFIFLIKKRYYKINVYEKRVIEYIVNYIIIILKKKVI